MLQAYKGKDKSKGKNETMMQDWIRSKSIPKCQNKTHPEGCTEFNPSCNLEFVGDLEAWRAYVQRKRAAAAAAADASAEAKELEETKQLCDEMESDESTLGPDWG